MKNDFLHCSLIIAFALFQKSVGEVDCPKPMNTTTRRKSQRVYKGYECNATKFPFLVAICKRAYGGGRGTVFCGGTILTSNLVLTAAHCTSEVDPRKLNVALHPDTKQEYLIEVSDFINHPQYEPSKVTRPPMHDVAILILNRYITNVPVTRFPKKKIKGEIYNYCKEGLAMGWGNTVATGHLQPDTLLCARLSLISINECKKATHNNLEGMTEYILCTKSLEEKDVCTGDSGGPLMCGDEQIGVVSSGPQCGDQQGRPGIWYRTDMYYKFMAKVFKNEMARKAISAGIDVRPILLINLILIVVNILVQ